VSIRMDDRTDGQRDDGMDDGPDGFREASFLIPTSFTLYNIYRERDSRDFHIYCPGGP